VGCLFLDLWRSLSFSLDVVEQSQDRTIGFGFGFLARIANGFSDPHTVSRASRYPFVVSLRR